MTTAVNYHSLIDLQAVLKCRAVLSPQKFWYIVIQCEIKNRLQHINVRFFFLSFLSFFGQDRYPRNSECHLICWNWSKSTPTLKGFQFIFYPSIQMIINRARNENKMIQYKGKRLFLNSFFANHFLKSVYIIPQFNPTGNYHSVVVLKRPTIIWIQFFYLNGN